MERIKKMLAPNLRRTARLNSVLKKALQDF
jgi:hypothetical protein